ncbi:MAG TPA: M17 family peptidase N-terminal domain-containing protein [Polyangiaceae bacterium]|nr:M17 family peptidase N-terminal domain-containing protein [Polyangiaceae bacterium]
MELRFLAPELRRLDEASVEVSVCSIWQDERPVRGFAGLLDWRMGGRLSAQIKAGFMTGALGEALLMPGRPHVPFEKVLVLGLGRRATFSEETFREVLAQATRALEGLRVRRAVLELPGRAGGAIDPETAIALTLQCVGASSEHDAWWLVETAADQRRIEARAADERRRARAI